MKRRVVITGLGIVSPIGNNTAENLNALKEGLCGIDYIKSFDTSDMSVKVAGEIKDLNLEDYFSVKEIRRMDRFIALSLIAGTQAMDMAGLSDFAESDNDEKLRAGVIMATGIGGLNIITSEYEKMLTKGARFISPYFVPAGISNIAAAQLSIKYSLMGTSLCVSTACAAGTNAVGEAFRQIRDGYQDVMLCGGTESCVTKFGVGGFSALKALSTTDDPSRACIPFDKNRNGFVMGEGAGALVLEEYDHAIKRGANIICEVYGYGSNCDAYHTTAPRSDGMLAMQCMNMAINDASLLPSDIDYINAHGTSTPMNDRGESAAINQLFKEASSVHVSSTKSSTGHLLGASGAVEAVFLALSVQNDFCPQNVGYTTPDEECNINLVLNKPLDKKINYAMSNSFGFGGHNASIIFGKVN